MTCPYLDLIEGRSESDTTYVCKCPGRQSQAVELSAAEFRTRCLGEDYLACVRYGCARAGDADEQAPTELTPSTIIPGP